MTATRPRAAPAGDDSPPEVRQRRRGVALEAAILTAAFAELTAAGYAAFAVEGVAARARTGKASIYRRWPTKQELVLDALLAELPTIEDGAPDLPHVLPDDVSTIDALHRIGDAIVTMLSSPAGRAMRAIKLEAHIDPELAALIDERFQAPRQAALQALLRRGIDRGEVRPDAAVEIVADVLPAVLVHRVMLQRQTMTAADVRDVIEQVMIPLVEAR